MAELQSVTVDFLRSIFPKKDHVKLEQWVKVLHDEEVEVVQDAAILLVENPPGSGNTPLWDALSLPLVIKGTLKDHFKGLLTPPEPPQPHQADPVHNPDQGEQKPPATVTTPRAGPTGAPPATTTAATASTAVAPTTSSSSSSPTPSSQTKQRKIKQIDVIVLDVSLSMKSRSNVDATKTREDVAKVMFHTMVDRLLALEMEHSLCLVSFGLEILEVKSPTLEYEKFHDEMGRLTAGQNGTKLFDAVSTAADTLISYSSTHVELLDAACPLRIFTLTDGEDNCSEQKAWQVTQKLQRNCITLDSFLMGDPNLTLQAMSTASGGFCVSVDTEQAGIAMFQRESLLHIQARLPSDRKPKEIVNSEAELNNLRSSSKILRKAPESHATFTALRSTVMSEANVQQQLKKIDDAQVDNKALKAVLKEYKDLMSSAAEKLKYQIFLVNDNVMEWKVLLQAPSDSLYDGAYFLCSLTMPSNYPRGDITVRMVTPIYHLNVTDDGKFSGYEGGCGPSMGTTAKIVLTNILDLMLKPDSNSPAEAFKGQLYTSDRAKYTLQAKAHTQENASTNLQASLTKYKLNE